MVRIIVYTKTGCPWCGDVLTFLNENKVEFEEREVLSNEEFFKELVDKSGQDKTPTLDIDGQIIADSDVDEVSEYLREKGIIS